MLSCAEEAPQLNSNESGTNTPPRGPPISSQLNIKSVGSVSLSRTGAGELWRDKLKLNFGPLMKCLKVLLLAPRSNIYI